MGAAAVRDLEAMWGEVDEAAAMVFGPLYDDIYGTVVLQYRLFYQGSHRPGQLQPKRHGSLDYRAPEWQPDTHLVCWNER
jgi:hypothetical protein